MAAQPVTETGPIGALPTSTSTSASGSGSGSQKNEAVETTGMGVGAAGVWGVVGAIGVLVRW